MNVVLANAPKSILKTTTTLMAREHDKEINPTRLLVKIKSERDVIVGAGFNPARTARG